MLLSQGEVKATRGGRAIVIKARTVQPPKPPKPPAQSGNAKAQDKSPGKKTITTGPRNALRGLPPITPEEADKQWRASLAKDEVAQMVATDHKAELLLKTFDIFIKSKKMPPVLVDKVRELHQYFCRGSNAASPELVEAAQPRAAIQNGSSDELQVTPAGQAPAAADTGGPGANDLSSMELSPPKLYAGGEALVSPVPVVTAIPRRPPASGDEGRNNNGTTITKPPYAGTLPPPAAAAATAATAADPPATAGRGTESAPPEKLVLELYPRSTEVEKVFDAHSQAPQLQLNLTAKKGVRSLLKYLTKTQWLGIITAEDAGRLFFIAPDDAPPGASGGRSVWTKDDATTTLGDIYMVLGRPKTLVLHYSWRDEDRPARESPAVPATTVPSATTAAGVAAGTPVAASIPVPAVSAAAALRAHTAPASAPAPAAASASPPRRLPQQQLPPHFTPETFGLGQPGESMPPRQPSLLPGPGLSAPPPSIGYAAAGARQSSFQMNLTQPSGLATMGQPAPQAGGWYNAGPSGPGIAKPLSTMAPQPYGAPPPQQQQQQQQDQVYNNQFGLDSVSHGTMPQGFGDEENSIMAELNNLTYSSPTAGSFSPTIFVSSAAGAASGEKRKASAIDLNCSPGKLARAWDAGSQPSLDKGLAF